MNAIPRRAHAKILVSQRRKLKLRAACRRLRGSYSRTLRYLTPCSRWAVEQGEGRGREGNIRPALPCPDRSAPPVSWNREDEGLHRIRLNPRAAASRLKTVFGCWLKMHKMQRLKQNAGEVGETLWSVANCEAEWAVDQIGQPFSPISRVLTRAMQLAKVTSCENSAQFCIKSGPNQTLLVSANRAVKRVRRGEGVKGCMPCVNRINKRRPTATATRPHHNNRQGTSTRSLALVVFFWLCNDAS